jgi:hypothetical protein
MKTYIFTVELQDENNNTQYKTVDSVYANIEDAKREATKKINIQKNMWKGSYTVKLGKGKVGLVNGMDGYSKIYHIQEMEVK